MKMVRAISCQSSVVRRVIAVAVLLSVLAAPAFAQKNEAPELTDKASEAIDKGLSRAILVITWLGLAIPSRWTALKEVSVVGLAWPFVSIFGVLMFFGVLALLLSLVLPSRRSAAMLSGLLLVADFFLVGLSQVNSDLESIAKVTPLYYYQGGAAIDEFNAGWVVALLAVAFLFALLAWWRFERRDIRVGGEGAWQRPARRSLTHLIPRRAAARPEVAAAEGAAAQR